MGPYTDRNGVTHDYTHIGSSLHFCFCWLAIDDFSYENMTLSTAILCPPLCLSVVINKALSAAILCHPVCASVIINNTRVLPFYAIQSVSVLS